jgi:branched-chain amino acid transport system substrate-binding protein
MTSRGSTRRKRRTLVIIGSTVLALVVAATSTLAAQTTVAATNGGGTVVATSVATTPATDAPTTEVATTVADPLGTPKAASGDPIVIGTINEGGSDALGAQSALTLSGIQIAAKYANDYLGGIGGHPIQIESCGNKATPAGATDCANQMVEKKISAYIQPYSGEEAAIVPIITKAGIPMMITSGADASALTTPGVFNATGGIAAALGADAIQAKAKGIKKMAFMVIDVPAATQGVGGLGGIAFKKEGVGFDVVPVAVGTPDMSPQIQSAIAGGADALGVVGDVTFCTSFFQAYKTLALTVPKYIISVCIDPSVIAAAGDVLDGSNVGVTIADGPDTAIYAASTKKYGDGIINPNPNVSAGVAAGWGSMMNLVNAMAGYTGATDPASILAQIKAAKNVPLPLSGGLTFTCDGTAIPIIPDICSAGIQMAAVDSKGGLGGYNKVDAAEAYAS